MHIEVTRVEVQEIVPLRELHRHEMYCQIVHDSFARRGCSDAYLIQVDGRRAGYGLVANQHHPDTVNELYLIPAYRAAALPIFQALLDVSRATAIRAQSNDPLLFMLLQDCARQISSDVLLFADAFTSRLDCPDAGAVLSKAGEPDQQEWAIESQGAVVATGGLLFHYNPPFGDIYMDVQEAHRRRGFGSYLVQELKRIAYEIGRVPAARCSASHLASRRTLQKAGMLPCGRIFKGDVAPVAAAADTMAADSTAAGARASDTTATTGPGTTDQPAAGPDSTAGRDA